MKIYLCARENDLFRAWTMHHQQYDFVVPTKQDIMSIDAEALVSPANSFGFMTGGIDLHYKNYLGQEMEDDLRKRIAKEFDHELCVGQATSVELWTTPPLVHYKYLIAAPTMRMPENVSHTINAFLAAKAALIEAKKIGAESIVFPGMGTGTGVMSAQDCAKQVSAAIRYVLVEERVPKDLYEEQDFVRKYVISEKWFKVQMMGEE